MLVHLGQILFDVPVPPVTSPPKGGVTVTVDRDGLLSGGCHVVRPDSRLMSWGNLPCHALSRTKFCSSLAISLTRRLTAAPETPAAAGQADGLTSSHRSKAAADRPFPAQFMLALTNVRNTDLTL